MSNITTGYVPNYRCGIEECENINNATYYDKEILPFGNWTEHDQIYSSFVELAIGQINPKNKTKFCKRIPWDDSDLPSPVDLTTSRDTCSSLEEGLNQKTNG